MQLPRLNNYNCNIDYRAFYYTLFSIKCVANQGEIIVQFCFSFDRILPQTGVKI